MKKPNQIPTVINLSEITEDGEVYEYSTETGELNEALKDLITNHKYKVVVKIRDIGDAYELSGEVKTSLDLTCSRCAFDFVGPLYFKINELVMIEDASTYKNGSQSRQNYITHNGDNETFCHMVPSPVFDIGEFIHEQIAINTPLHPTGKADCDDSCDNLKEAIEKGWLSVEKAKKEQDANTHRPFEALAKVKLNS